MATFLQRQKKLFIPSLSSVKFLFPASKLARAQASHQNGFSQQNTAGMKTKNVTSILILRQRQSFFMPVLKNLEREKEKRERNLDQIKQF